MQVKTISNVVSARQDMQKLELESDVAVNADVNDDDIDEDVCTKQELLSYFPCVSSTNEVDVGSPNTYVMYLSATVESNPTVAAGLSNHTCQIYRTGESGLSKSESLSLSSNAVGVKFSSDNNRTVYTATSDGTALLWDLRVPSKPAVVFTDEHKTFTCCDVSFDDRLIAAGTELVDSDAFILFWDVRNRNLMGGYWESHTDDVTQIKFLPNDLNKLMSCSTDGLINYYDLSQSNEDDALLDTLNTESSAEQLLWFKRDNKNAICCVTHTAEVQLWSPDDAMPFARLKRDDIAGKLMRKSESYCYVAGVCTRRPNDGLLLFAGSNYPDGECFRALNVCEGVMSPFCSFRNNQRVRSVWYNENTQLLITGGEQGLINVWSLSDVQKGDSTTFGMKGKRKNKF